MRNSWNQTSSLRRRNKSGHSCTRCQRSTGQRDKESTKCSRSHCLAVSGLLGMQGTRHTSTRWSSTGSSRKLGRRYNHSRCPRTFVPSDTKGTRCSHSHYPTAFAQFHMRGTPSAYNRWNSTGMSHMQGTPCSHSHYPMAFAQFHMPGTPSTYSHWSSTGTSRMLDTRRTCSRMSQTGYRYRTVSTACTQCSHRLDNPQYRLSWGSRRSLRRESNKTGKPNRCRFRTSARCHTATRKPRGSGSNLANSLTDETRPCQRGRDRDHHDA